MNKTQIEELQVRFAAFIKDRNITQARAAREIGVNSGAISGFISGKYPGDMDKLAGKIVDWINTHTRREQRKTPDGFIDTAVARKIAAVIMQTNSLSDDNEGKIGFIIGDAGHGKSVCLRQYANVHANSVYVGLDDTMSSVAIFSEIAKQIGIDNAGSLKKLTRMLVEKLETRHMTIMLDEASALDVRKLSQLRQVITVKCKCPLILSGNSHLLGTITQPSTRRGYESLDQFTSRITYLLNLDELANSDGLDGGGLYTEEDIKKLYQYGGIRLTPDAVFALKKICSTAQSGRLRTCSHIMSALHQSDKVKEKRTIDATIITAAIRQLGLPIWSRLPFIFEDIRKEIQRQDIAKTA